MATLESLAVPILSHVLRLAGEKDVDLRPARGRAMEILEATTVQLLETPPDLQTGATTLGLAPLAQACPEISLPSDPFTLHP